jgi:aminoglycoside phosphotransferase (APT) family kinase protein
MTGAPALPWESEFNLDARMVRALIESQFPDLPVTSIRYLHEGWDSAAFLVNEAWIFRFPKRRERQAWLESEVAVLQLLGRQPLELSIPVPVYLGQASSLYPCGFMGYRLIDGIQGDTAQLHQVEREDSARRFGRFLAALHSVDVREAVACGVRPHESRLKALLAETITTHDMIWGKLPRELKELCQPYLEGNCAVPEISELRHCLVHGDLVDEHVLLNGEGAVTGLIDWGDACLSDPAVDFSGLYAWLGEEFVRDVLKHYSLSWGASFLEQIRFRGRCLALITYGHSLAGRDSSQADRLPMVWTAFGPGTR